MTRDTLEFLIAQYADGTLPASEVGALEQVLATDAEARRMLEEYRLTDAALKALPADLPGMRWDELASSISGSITRMQADASAFAIPEGLEFSLAQYADGSLPEDRRAGVEARLAKDPAARLMLRDYEAVDAAMLKLAREIDPPPVVAWDKLAAQISAAVAQQAAGADSLGEQAEFELAQYADGTLSADRVAAVEARIAEDPAAAALVAEYRQLESAIVAARADRPDVRWGVLADHLSTTVLGEAEEVEETSSFKLFAWIRQPMRLAAAAAVVLATGLGIALLNNRGQTPPTNIAVVPTPTIVQIAKVEIGQPEAATGSAVVEIQIGPSAALAKSDGDSGFIDVGIGDDLVSRPSRTVIASGVGARQDGSFLPF